MVGFGGGYTDNLLLREWRKGRIVDEKDTTLTIREKVHAILEVIAYRPLFSTAIIILSILSAVLEGIGLTSLLPIIEEARGKAGPSSDVTKVFAEVYGFLGIPFEIGFILGGVAVVMTIRYLFTGLVEWLKTRLRVSYIQRSQTEAFERALDTRIGYYDREGTDEILNAIVTQSRYASSVIGGIVLFFQTMMIALMYFAIAVYLAPRLTIGAMVFLLVFLVILRSKIEGGISVGSNVADANERVQTAVQAGTQGIRDVRLFNMADELYADFLDAIEKFGTSKVAEERNQIVMDTIYKTGIAIAVFTLLYLTFEFTTLSLGGIGVFIFALFRFTPRLSKMNNTLYSVESNLPHFMRTKAFIEELEREAEATGQGVEPPSTIERTAFENVSFTYPAGDRVLSDVTFSVDREDFVAFVGPSGAGKSTIVSLLARLYEPDSGQITANGQPISEFDVTGWRDRIAVVRQHPYIFNDTLRYNLTVDNREASEAEIKQACEIAQITEFLDELSDGLETHLGDEGVRLSGGQRQRVAIARAILKGGELLVFDEATSELDTRLEATVHSKLLDMDREFTLLVVAHRLSTVREADRIYALKNGRIAEAGTHDELIDDGGVYAKLHESKEYEPAEVPEGE